MIVVTLVCVSSGLFARSRYCAEQAAFHRNQLPQGMSCGRKYEPGKVEFHTAAAVAFERVARMPWLPLMFPSQPVPIPVDAEKELEKQRALDALRDALAKEAREKYGVP